MTKYRIVEEKCGYAFVELVENPKRATVVMIDRKKGQVYSAMPSDQPADGGQWFGGISDKGIAYVSGLYSRGYARRKFREFTAPVTRADYEDLGLEVIDYDALVSAEADA